MAEKIGAQLESGERLKALMAMYFLDLKASDEDARGEVAWCSSVGPAELLRSMGFKVFFPENHAALLGASRTAAQTMPKAHALGFSQDICSYLTSDIGAFCSGFTPLTKALGMERVPRPSVLVYNTSQCREVKDWFEWYGRALGVPVLGIHSPVELDTLLPEVVADVAAQFQRVRDGLAPLAPSPFSPGALEEVMALSREASLLWSRCLEVSARKPAPWTFFDHTIHMAPIVVLRGTRQAVDYYAGLLAELETHAAESRAAVPGERFRVYWDGMPIWGQLRALSELFSGYGAALVASTYCNSWILEDQDPEDSWTSMARTYLATFICRSEAYKEAYIVRKAREFGAGGLIFHDSKTCPHNSNSRYGMPQRIKESQGLPVLVMEGDLNDPRCFSFEESRVRLEVFLEQLEEARK